MEEDHVGSSHSTSSPSGQERCSVRGSDEALAAARRPCGKRLRPSYAARRAVSRPPARVRRSTRSDRGRRCRLACRAAGWLAGWFMDDGPADAGWLRRARLCAARAAWHALLRKRRESRRPDIRRPLEVERDMSGDDAVDHSLAMPPAAMLALFRAAHCIWLACARSSQHQQRQSATL